MSVSLGQLLPEDHDRDVAQIAAIPIVMTEVMMPGQAVTAKGGTAGKYIGVVDPFLQRALKPGDRAWVLVYPQFVADYQVTWISNEFPANAAFVTSTAEQRDEAKRWLTAFAASVSIDKGVAFTYDDLMKGLKRAVETGENIEVPGVQFDEDDYDDKGPDLWKRFEALTGFGNPNSPDWVPFERDC